MVYATLVKFKAWIVGAFRSDAVGEVDKGGGASAGSEEDKGKLRRCRTAATSTQEHNGFRLCDAGQAQENIARKEFEESDEVFEDWGAAWRMGRRRLPISALCWR